ncbi:MAG: hypothetical protein ACLTDR_04930 [Adlercreutzia equolifaciens]
MRTPICRRRSAPSSTACSWARSSPPRPQWARTTCGACMEACPAFVEQRAEGGEDAHLPGVHGKRVRRRPRPPSATW